MKILLVEPQLRKSVTDSDAKINDDSLLYPPIGLLKISRYHKNKKDDVFFASGCEKQYIPQLDLFNPNQLFDRIYVSAIFTFSFDIVVETINFYLPVVGGTRNKIYIGGIMASLMPDELLEATGVNLIEGLLTSSSRIDFDDGINIDALPPDYSVLDPHKYAINDTYYAYTTRGCVNHCAWCGVPSIEPQFIQYIDIKPSIKQLRLEYGDKPLLKLMDNNILPSKELNKIVNDLVELGYGKNSFTESKPKKIRSIDFNQGMDASFFTEDRIALIAKLNIKPMRIAFDRIEEKDIYIQALELAHKHGFLSFSNYILYNFTDTPKDLFERLYVNIDLNNKWSSTSVPSKIYSYPMQYAPIHNLNGDISNQIRNVTSKINSKEINWNTAPIWTRRFARNVEIIKGVAHGAITPTPSLAKRAIGYSLQEFIANLYMPEELLRNRNAHEKNIRDGEPNRDPGDGLIEQFRIFINNLLIKQDDEFFYFHDTVSQNSIIAIKDSLKISKYPEASYWLSHYLRKQV